MGPCPLIAICFQGPCVDLNFMASKSLRADARIVHLNQGLTMLESPESALIFSVEAPCCWTAMRASP